MFDTCLLWLISISPPFSTRSYCKLQTLSSNILHFTNILISCSKFKSGRVKRSEGAKYFQPSDIVISGVSSGGENTWIVNFSALFPSVNGQAPQPIPHEYIVRMVNESKGTIEKAFGSKINRIAAEPIPRPSKNKSIVTGSFSECA